VYRALQHGLNRTVALKMVLAGTYAPTEALIRFLAEAETAARLQHQGIAQIFDSGRAGGLPYFTMEFVDSGSLADRVRSGPLPPAEAARVARELADAVAVAHAHGVIHRDLRQEREVNLPAPWVGW
jgi:serine/threonine-protein kinase